MSISSWAGKPLSDAVCHFPVYFLLLPPVCFSQLKKSIKSVLEKQELANRGKHILQSPSTLLGRKLEMPVLDLEKQSLTYNSIDNQQRAVCRGGRPGIAGLDRSISPAPSSSSLYVPESINSCLPFMSGLCKTGCTGNLEGGCGTAVSRAYPEASVSPSSWNSTGESEDRTGMWQAEALADERICFLIRTHSAFPSNTTLLNQYLKRTKW